VLPCAPLQVVGGNAGQLIAAAAKYVRAKQVGVSLEEGGARSVLSWHAKSDALGSLGVVHPSLMGASSSRLAVLTATRSLCRTALSPFRPCALKGYKPYGCAFNQR